MTEAHRCEKLAQGFYAACPAETRTHDLLIASPTHKEARRGLIGFFVFDWLAQAAVDDVDYGQAEIKHLDRSDE